MHDIRTRPVSGLFAFGLVAALSIASTARASGAACHADTDCKGDRICEDGYCVNPQPAAPVTHHPSMHATPPPEQNTPAPAVLAPPPRPPPPLAAGDMSWSTISGTTDAPGHDVLTASGVFPGFTFGYQHGVNSFFDVGAAMDLDYAPGVDAFAVPVFELNFRAPLRFHVLQSGIMNLMVHVDPGIFVTTGGLALGTGFGLIIWPGATLSFDVYPGLRVGPSIELPMGVDFLNGGVFSIAALFGGELEYTFYHDFSIGLKLGFGPSYSTGGPGVVDFGLIAMPVFGWRI